MTENFLASLRVMGLGLLGIFTVAVVLMLIMMLLTKIFPAKQQETDEEIAAEEENAELSESADKNRISS